MGDYGRLIQEMQAILSKKKRPADQRIGVIHPPAMPDDWKKFDALMSTHLGCSLPSAYRKFLEQNNGVSAQGSVLFGTDVSNGKDPSSWPKLGIVYASLMWLEDAKVSPWIAVGEDEFEVFAISRDGNRFAKIAGGTEEVQKEFKTLDELICTAVERMVFCLNLLDD